MSHLVRWLHLSDFHVGKDNYGTRKMFEYILKLVQQRHNSGWDPDFIFITGDVAQSGGASEYESFWLDFVVPLQELIGGEISKQTFVVPGNHDADRKENPAFDRTEIVSAGSKYLDPTEEGLRLRSMLLPRFKQFIENDMTETKGMFESMHGAYSRVVHINEIPVGIVGVNTAWLSKDEQDERRLTPGKSLLESSLNSVSAEGVHLKIVLGHHPVGWFVPALQRPIMSLLGQHRAIYLHGHLHDSWAEPNYGGGYPYLAIQSGACFQAREGERWVNGVVWGEASLDEGCLRLQPMTWNSDQQTWLLQTDAFHEMHRKGEWWEYGLPSTRIGNLDYTPKQHKTISLPRGWSVLTPDDLSQYCKPLEAAEAVRFFDGAVPDWPVALSTSIPQRSTVKRLAGHFSDVRDGELPKVCLLLAAGCEGKTTALLQAAFEVTRQSQEWRILQRRDEAQSLNVEELQKVVLNEFKWLLVIDEADRAAADVLTFLRTLPEQMRGRVHCMMACRDSDWRSARANTLNWSMTSFTVEQMSGLDLEDAEAVVAAWEMYGPAGLGQLTKVPEKDRAQLLISKAIDEAKVTAGAFFGALLAVRTGADLRGHARVLLDRLSQRKLENGATLSDALGFISVMHAENLLFLSRPVLAKALHIDPRKLHREVLIPLGQEAAATATSSFIFTRHKRIAETLASIIETEFGEDLGSLFEQLVIAAIDLIKNGEYLPENPACWRFELPEHFRSSGKSELAVRLAKAALSCEPENSITRTGLANLFRQLGKLDLAVKTFRQAPAKCYRDPIFYFEWGVIEGELHRYDLNALLAAYSISDQSGDSSLPKNERTHVSLSGLGVPFRELYTFYSDSRFRDARMAAAVLGKKIRYRDATSQAYLQIHFDESKSQGAPVMGIPEALTALAKGVWAIADVSSIDQEVASHTGAVRDLTFKKLERLIAHQRN